MTLTLQRVTRHPAVTQGVLLDEQGVAICVTLEEPDLHNAPNVSCIPPGTYVAHRILSPKREVNVYELAGVPGRGNIQLHSGNTTLDIEGCILLGSNFGSLNQRPAVLGSLAAFKAFMDRYTAPTLTLVVRDAPWTP